MPKSIKSSRRKVKRKPGIDWVSAPDIKKRVLQLISRLGITSFDSARIYCFRSTNAQTRAYARIWGLSRVWQQALEVKPAYVLEVISEKFDRLNAFERDRVLLHELAHIPLNFSGALSPHARGKGRFHDKLKHYEHLFDSWRE